MTNEELLAAINAANKPLLEKLNSLESELATVKNAKKEPAGDPIEDAQQIRAQVAAEKDAEHSVKLRKAKEKAYSASLSEKTKTPVSYVAKKLASFKSEEAMDVYYEQAMKAAEEDVKLGIEREHGDSPDLKQEYENMKARYPSEHEGLELRQTFEDYVRNSKYISPEGLAARSDRHAARGVTPVRNTEEAFA